MNRWTVEKDDGGWWWAVSPEGRRVVGRISREGAEEAAELFFKASAAKGWTVRRNGRDWDVIDPDGHTVGVRISEVGAVELMVELAEAAQAQAEEGEKAKAAAKQETEDGRWP